MGVGGGGKDGNSVTDYMQNKMNKKSTERTGSLILLWPCLNIRTVVRVHVGFGDMIAKFGVQRRL